MMDQEQTILGFEVKQGGEEVTPESYLSEHVGEGKKYSSLDEAAVALAKKALHADAFIETLKKEKQGVEAEILSLRAKERTAEELLSAIKGTDQESIMCRNQEMQEEKKVITEQGQKAGLSEEDINKLLTAAMEKKDKEFQEALVRKEKEEAVKNTLLNAFDGDEAAVSSVLASYAGDSTEKKAALIQLGMTDPNALAMLLKGYAQKEVMAPDLGGSKGLKHTTATMPGTLTWTEAQRIKKSNPGYYNSFNFQKKLNAAVIGNPNFYKT